VHWLDRAPASDAIVAAHWACRRTPLTANLVRCLGIDVPIALFI
jgi:hypothetical protein